MVIRSKRWQIAIASAATTVLIAWGWHWQQLRATDAALLRAWPAQLLRQPQLIRSAVTIAEPVYAAHCAACHGKQLSGKRPAGIPSLDDSVWLYRGSDLSDIENTILYGIRSGHPKSHNVTDMPAEGRTHQLMPNEVADVVEYVLALSGQTHDDAASQRGHVIYDDKGNCFDCHAGDAGGAADYGAPSLRGPVFIYGSDRATLYRSVYDGRHGLCPAWTDVLTPAQIRALAVYLYIRSHPSSS